MDSLYDFEVKVSPDVCANTYVAKIIGEDPIYKFQREFVPITQHETEDGYRCEPELGDYGVYERSTKWFEDKPGGKFLGRSRQWYLVFDCGSYKIPEWAVTGTWRWLTLYLATHGGDAA